ncbi:hypothetical protein CC80DRAFT_590679 [Byssothecium circinans]|uniref:Uncharacterized protein n=1 Tax=Byssothecium circinans TaxID=147558 RepID=A0A6A5UH73_9PLEO|nr:hypothetical protein CC80DRAFT_590679 [Byssothecium circinans]
MQLLRTVAYRHAFRTSYRHKPMLRGPVSQSSFSRRVTPKFPHREFAIARALLRDEEPWKGRKSARKGIRTKHDTSPSLVTQLEPIDSIRKQEVQQHLQQACVPIISKIRRWVISNATARKSRKHRRFSQNKRDDAGLDRILNEIRQEAWNELNRLISSPSPPFASEDGKRSALEARDLLKRRVFTRYRAAFPESMEPGSESEKYRHFTCVARLQTAVNRILKLLRQRKQSQASGQEENYFDMDHIHANLAILGKPYLGTEGFDAFVQAAVDSNTALDNKLLTAEEIKSIQDFAELLRTSEDVDQFAVGFDRFLDQWREVAIRTVTGDAIPLDERDVPLGAPNVREETTTTGQQQGTQRRKYIDGLQSGISRYPTRSFDRRIKSRFQIQFPRKDELSEKKELVEDLFLLVRLLKLTARFIHDSIPSVSPDNIRAELHLALEAEPQDVIRKSLEANSELRDKVLHPGEEAALEKFAVVLSETSDGDELALNFYRLAALLSRKMSPVVIRILKEAEKISQRVGVLEINLRRLSRQVIGEGLEEENEEADEDEDDDDGGVDSITKDQADAEEGLGFDDMDPWIREMMTGVTATESDFSVWTDDQQGYVPSSEVQTYTSTSDQYGSDISKTPMLRTEPKSRKQKANKPRSAGSEWNDPQSISNAGTVLKDATGEGELNSTFQPDSSNHDNNDEQRKEQHIEHLPRAKQAVPETKEGLGVMDRG